MSLEVHNKTLRFTDGIQFSKFLKTYKNNEEKWKAVTSDFVSMEEYLAEIPESDLDVIDKEKKVVKHQDKLVLVEEGREYFIKPSIDSRLLRNIVNENANLIIGDTLYHITYDKTYFVSMHKYEEGKPYESMADRVVDIKRNRNSTIDTRSSLLKYKHYCRDGHWKRRINMELHDYYNGFYEEASVGLESYKRAIFGTWKRTHADELTMNGHVTMTFELKNDPNTYTNTYYISDGTTDVVDLEKRFYSNYTITGGILNVLSWSGTNMVFFADDTSGCASTNDPTATDVIN